MQGAIRTANILYLQQQGRHAYPLMAASTTRHSKAFQVVLIGMMRMPSAINELSCYVTMHGHCYSMWGQSKGTRGVGVRGRGRREP